MKKNQEPQPTLSSSEETNSDTSSSSSEGEGLPLAPLPASTVGKRLATQKKDKAVDSKLTCKSSNSAASPRTPAKRALPLDGEESKKPKKEKGKAVGAQEEAKKSTLFQRLWSDDDEIVVLKGMLEYKEKKGVDPMVDANDFHHFIKKSLHVDVDRKQMVDKIRRLRKRYSNSVSNGKRNFTAHEQNAFDLSKKIWGHNVEGADVEQQTKSNMKTRRVLKAETSARNGDVSSESKKEVEDNDPGMDKEKKCWQFIGKSCMLMGLDENIVRVGLELCTEEMKSQVENKWKELYLEESNLFLKKLDLAREESKIILEALKSVEK